MNNIYEFNNTWLWTKNHNQFSNQQWKMATGMWKKFISFMKQNPSDGVNKEGKVPDENYLMSYQDRAFKDAFKLIIALSEQCNSIIDTKFNEQEINSQQQNLFIKRVHDRNEMIFDDKIRGEEARPKIDQYSIQELRKAYSDPQSSQAANS